MRLDYGVGPPNGPVLVFLHGFPGAWPEYEPVYRLLLPHYHLIAPTMRGMGSSARAAPYRIADWIADAGRFIREIVGPGVVGVGHSAGSWFGLGAAVDDPDLFSAFVSLDQPLDPQVHVQYHQGRRAGVVAMAEAMRRASDVDDLRIRLAAVPASAGGTWGDLLSDEELAAQARDLWAHDPEIFASWVDDGLESFILVPELQRWPGSYRNPLLFIDGDPEAGSLVSAAGAEYNLERYPWAMRVEMAGRDHNLGLWDDPGPVVEEIRRFFGELNQAGGDAER